MPRTKLPPRDVAADLQAARAIAIRLAAEPSGSRVLDIELAIAAGMLSDFAISVIESPKDASPMATMAVDEAVPALTTSLDASLEGEDIVETRRLPEAEGAGWRATHREIKRGRERLFVGTGRTEALARRNARVQAGIAGLEAKLRRTAAKAEA